VESIDFARKELHCRPSVSDIGEQDLTESAPFTVKYDKLALAPGCDVQTFSTPGALEHSNFLRTTDDARRVQQRLLEMLDAASIPGLTSEQQQDILRIIVVGGGAIGIEATAELWDLWQHDLRHIYPHLYGQVSIEVHDVGPSVLGTFDQRLGEYALHKLENRGVKILEATSRKSRRAL
jgi:NADH:ubiquinone reductase (non-electrogenic)